MDNEKIESEIKDLEAKLEKMKKDKANKKLKYKLKNEIKEMENEKKLSRQLFKGLKKIYDDI